MTLKGWSKEISFPVSTKADDEKKKIKVSTNKWDLVNILNFKVSMQMCNKSAKLHLCLFPGNSTRQLL